MSTSAWTCRKLTRVHVTLDKNVTIPQSTNAHSNQSYQFPTTAPTHSDSKKTTVNTRRKTWRKLHVIILLPVFGSKSGQLVGATAGATMRCFEYTEVTEHPDRRVWPCMLLPCCCCGMLLVAAACADFPADRAAIAAAFAPSMKTLSLLTFCYGPLLHAFFARKHQPFISASHHELSAPQSRSPDHSISPQSSTSSGK
jgi:hypothetical protein